MCKIKELHVLGLSAFLFCGCYQNNYSGQINSSRQVSFESNRFSRNFNTIFGVQLTNYDSTFYIVTLDSSLKLQFKSIEVPGKEFEIDCKEQFLSFHYFTVRFYNDRLYVLDFNDYSLNRYKFDRDTLYLETRFDLNKFVDLKKYWIRFQMYKSFEVEDSVLYVAYGIRNKKTNFLDDGSYFKIDLRNIPDTISTISKLLHCPRVFKANKYRNSNAFLIKTSDTSFLYGFENYDSIYVYNHVSCKMLRAAEFSGQTFYRRYNEKKASDLAYIRWYDQTGETNFKMLLDGQGHCLILKRQKREELKDSSVYEYYYLDRDLKVVAHNLFPYELNPYYCFSYDNRFLIFNSDLTKAFFYEL